MAASYPAGFDTMSDPAANLSGPPLHSTMHNQINDVLEAIEAELGLNPSGADATVAATLAALSTRYAPVNLGVHSLTTAFVTAATHTTFQDEGLTLTLTPPAGRRWKFTVMVNPFVSGGSNSVTYRLLAGATTLRDWSIPPEALATGGAHSMTLMHTQILGALGSTVFKVQIAAVGANTAVNSFGSAAFVRQLLIEDIGIL